MNSKQEGNQGRHRRLVQSVAVLHQYQLANKDGRFRCHLPDPLEITTTDIDLTNDLLEAVIELTITGKPSMMGLTGGDDPQNHQSPPTTESLGEK